MMSAPIVVTNVDTHTDPEVLELRGEVAALRKVKPFVA